MKHKVFWRSKGKWAFGDTGTGVGVSFVKDVDTYEKLNDSLGIPVETLKLAFEDGGPKSYGGEPPEPPASTPHKSRARHKKK